MQPLTGHSSAISMVGNRPGHRDASSTGSISEARALAVEGLRDALGLYVRLDTSLQDKLVRTAGGFMTCEEVQEIRSLSSNREKMDKVLNTLLQRDDRAFDSFVDVLGCTGHAYWGRRLQEEALTCGGTSAQSPAALQMRPVTDSSATNARIRQLESQTWQQQVELAAMRSQLGRYAVEVERERDQQAATIEEQAVRAECATAQWNAALMQRDQTIEHQARLITQLRDTVAQLEQTLARQRPSLQQPAITPAAGSCSPGAALVDLDRLAKARHLLQQMQKNPLVTDQNIQEVIPRLKPELTKDNQLCTQIDPVIEWVVNQDGGFINRDEKGSWEGLAPGVKLSRMLDCFAGKWRWGEVFSSQKKAVDWWIMLLQGLNEHACFSAVDVLLNGLESIGQGCPAGHR